MHKNSPTIVRSIKSRVIAAKQFFTFSIRKHFSAAEGPLSFELTNAPIWLKMNGNSGVLSGIAPSKAHDHQFLITVKAKNEWGEISQSFFIKVMETNVVEAYAHTLETLQKEGHDIPHQHELLEYYFEYIQASSEKNTLLQELREKALELNIHLPEEIQYKDFKKAITQINPTLIEQLTKQFENENITINAELNNKEFSNLYRQGSAPAGSHVIAVWNYLAFADYHRWSETKNVLDQAADRIIELKKIAQHAPEVEMDKPHPTFSPKR